MKCIKLIVDGLNVQVGLFEGDIIPFEEYGFDDFETDMVETQFTICGGYYMDYCISEQLSWYDMFEYFNAFQADRYGEDGGLFATLTSTQHVILVNNVNVWFDFSGTDLVKSRGVGL